jgi:hypothetical protein
MIVRESDAAETQSQLQDTKLIVSMAFVKRTGRFDDGGAALHLSHPHFFSFIRNGVTLSSISIQQSGSDN